MCNDVTPSQGRAYIGGYDISMYPAKVKRLLGYCPQFDALHENMTARESLYFYGTIRGIAANKLDRMVAYLIDRLSLTEYADRPCGTYSGGNKRKLSVGIALIGNPPVVFLSEQTPPESTQSTKRVTHTCRTRDAARFSHEYCLVTDGDAGVCVCVCVCVCPF